MELNVRTASIKRQRRNRLSGLLWKVSAVVIVVALLAVTARFASEKFFFKNSEYSLLHLVTHLNGVMTEEELIKLTGFAEGKTSSVSISIRQIANLQPYPKCAR